MMIMLRLLLRPFSTLSFQVELCFAINIIRIVHCESKESVLIMQ
jgi:hypothetical protein